MTPPPFPAIDGSAVEAPLPTRAMLIALLAGASLAFSMAFACATPFAALAAVAVLRMKRGEALAAVTLAWLVNQADGYLFMHYPRTWDSFGWGAAIWLAAMAAAFGASAAATLTRRLPLATICIAIVAAFGAYEGVLVAATLILPSSTGAFAVSVVGRLLAINVVAFGLLFALIGLLKIIALRLPGAVMHARLRPVRGPAGSD